MGKTETIVTNGFADLFNIDHSTLNQREPIETVKDAGSEIAKVGGIEELEKKIIEEEEPIQGEVKEVEVKEVTQEVEEDSETTDVEALVQSLVKDNVLLFDEEKEYESSAKGIKQLIEETVTKSKASAIEEFTSSLGEDGARLLEILKSGGTVEDFVQMKSEVDFSKVPTIDADGNALEDNQMYLVQDWLEVQGHSKDEIDEMVADFKAGGLLQKQADLAKKKLAAWQEDKNTKLVQEKAQLQVKQKEEALKEAKEFEKQVLSTTEIAGFAIPKDKAKKLHEFITRPVKDGKTQFQLKDTSENRLLYAYMAMEGFNKDSLSKEVATKQAIKLKKELSQFRDTEASPKRGAEQIRQQQSADVAKEIKWLGF